MANAFVLLHYGDPGFDADRLYDLNPRPVPNWMCHLALATLMSFLPTLFVEKVFLSLYVLTFVLCVLYFLRSFGENREFLVLLAFPFIYSYPLMMGFYNFMCSVPLGLFVLGFYYRRRERWQDPRALLGLSLLLIALYFFHIISLLLTILGIAIFGIVGHRRDPSRVLPLFLAFLPSLGLSLCLFLIRGPGTIDRWDLGPLVRNFLRLGSLVPFDLGEATLTLALSALILGLFVYSLVSRRNGLIRKLRARRAVPRDALVLIALAYSALYFLLPSRMCGGAELTARLALFPFLVVLPWLETDIRAPLKNALNLLAVLISLAHLGLLTYHFKVFNEGLSEYTSGVHRVCANETLLPLCLDPWGRSDRVAPYLHASGYYTLESGALDLGNYEARTGYFPLRFKPGLDPYDQMGEIECTPLDLRPKRWPIRIDWVLVWGDRDSVPDGGWWTEGYRLIHREGRMQLFRRVSDPNPGRPGSGLGGS
jgi:hypothetical protein